MKDKIMLHNEFIKFWNQQGVQLKNSTLKCNAGNVIVHFHGNYENSHSISHILNNLMPRLSDVVAFEYDNGEICYRINDINYQEKQMLRVIKLKVFI